MDQDVKLKVLGGIISKVLGARHPIMGDANRKETVEEILQEYRSHLGFAFDLDNLIREEEKNEKEYKDRKLILSKKRSEYQNLCSHPITTFHPDASGNNDSWTECQVCGAEVPKSHKT